MFLNHKLYISVENILANICHNSYKASQTMVYSVPRLLRSEFLRSGKEQPVVRQEKAKTLILQKAKRVLVGAEHHRFPLEWTAAEGAGHLAGLHSEYLYDILKRPLMFSILLKKSELHRKEVTASILYINRLYPHSLFLTVLLTIEHYLRTYCIHR